MIAFIVKNVYTLSIVRFSLKSEVSNQENRQAFTKYLSWANIVLLGFGSGYTLSNSAGVFVNFEHAFTCWVVVIDYSFSEAYLRPYQTPMKEPFNEIVITAKSR